MVYLTKNDWSNLILSKLSKEESFKQEFLELYKIYNAINIFSKKIYTKANVQQSSFIAALIIFHKYRICSNFSLSKYSSEELYIILGACLFIGQRSINILTTKVDNISSFIKQLINKKNPNNNIEINELNKKLIQKEYDILTSIGFNIEIDSPFHFFYKLKTYLSKFEVNSSNFFTLLNYIVKDSFILPLSLYYTPNIITISCVKLLGERYKLDFINIKDLISLSDYTIDEEDINECTSLIQKLEAAINEKKSLSNCSSNSNSTNNVTDDEKGKISDNINENHISSGPSITKVIPSIKMNIE